MKRSGMFGVLLLVGMTVSVHGEDKPEPPALTAEQARREVRLLDDVYKTAVVLINDTFVEQGASAGDAARARVGNRRRSLRPRRPILGAPPVQ